MNFKSLIAMLCAGSMAAWAANNASVQAPMTGYIFDAQARAVRPMIGMPGGAYLGTPDGYRVGRRLGVARWFHRVRHGERATHFIRGLGRRKSNGRAGEWSDCSRLLRVEPDSTGAAIYSSTTRQAQILTHTAAGFSAGIPIDLSGIAGSVSAMAFDGQRIIVAATSGNVAVFTA